MGPGASTNVLFDLVSRVVAYGAGVEEEGGADHPVGHVLEHVAPVDGLGLPIVLQHHVEQNVIDRLKQF